MNEESKLPPLPEEAFDGDHESTKIEFIPCKHELYVVTANEARCKHCTACWTGAGVVELVHASKQ